MSCNVMERGIFCQNLIFNQKFKKSAEVLRQIMDHPKKIGPINQITIYQMQEHWHC